MYSVCISVYAWGRLNALYLGTMPTASRNPINKKLYSNVFVPFHTVYVVLLERSRAQYMYVVDLFIWGQLFHEQQEVGIDL